MTKYKHLDAIVTVQCFMVGAAIPPKSLRTFVYSMALFIYWDTKL